MDLIPTLFQLANAKTPWPMHGDELMPLLRDSGSRWPHPVLIEYFNEDFGAAAAQWTAEKIHGTKIYEPPSWWITFHQGRYRYIRWIVANEIEELYDIENDPDELRNPAVERRYRDTLADCRRRMETQIRGRNRALADRLPKPRVI